MKRFAYILHAVIITSTLISCTLFSQILGGDDDWIKPGGNIGEMALEQGSLLPVNVICHRYYGYPFEVPENICDLKDVQVWAFHRGKDPFVPIEAEQELVNALNACGGNAQFTVSQDMKFDVQNKIYADPKLYEWFLSQTLK